MMLWASYLGNLEIAEKIIRMGYSPFIKDLRRKTALMMAIEGG